MPQFRKKPVVIEARQFNASSDLKELKEWCGATDATETGNCSPEFPEGFDYPCLSIGTLEGSMKASIGDWIIKGVNGEFYPCKNEIFFKTYEPA
jgi:hypothetical protein